VANSGVHRCPIIAHRRHRNVLTAHRHDRPTVLVRNVRQRKAYINLTDPLDDED
jgi:hypothetical protein